MTRRSGRSLSTGVVAIAATASLLAACSSSSTGSSSSAIPTDTKLSGSITVWDTNYNSFEGYTTAAKKLDAEFTAKTGVTVVHPAQPFADYDKLLTAAFAAKSGPDVMMMVPGSQGVLRYTKGLVDLTNDVKDVRPSLKYWEATSPSLSADGNVYGIPVGTQADVFYYNKKLFTQAGLNPDKPPTTFDELMSHAAALKKAGITPFASGNKEGYENQWWFSTLWAGSQSVDDTISLAKGTIPMNDPKVKAAFTKYQQIQDAGYFASNRFSTPLFPDGVGSFSKGKGAMFLGLSDVAAHWGVFNPALGADNVGVFQAPGVTAATPQYYPVTATYVWSVPTYTPNKAGALAYVKFLASASSQQTQYDVAKSFPNNKDVTLTAAPANLTQMAASYQAGPTYQSAHQLIPGVVLSQLTTVINQVLQGRQSLDDALKGLQATNEKAHQNS